MVARYYTLSTARSDDPSQPDLGVPVQAAVVIGRPPAAFLDAAGLPVADGAPVPVVWDCLVDTSIDRGTASSALLTPAEWDANQLAQALAPYCLEATVQRSDPVMGMIAVRVKQADVQQGDVVLAQNGLPNSWLGRPDL